MKVRRNRRQRQGRGGRCSGRRAADNRGQSLWPDRRPGPKDPGDGIRPELLFCFHVQTNRKQTNKACFKELPRYVRLSPLSSPLT